jgi:cytochrome c oxidase assembly factor CtaG
MIAIACLAVVAGGIYLAAARGVRRWPPRRTAAFGAGLAVAVAALVPSEGGLIAHMVGHCLLVAVAAPLLILGRPVSLALRRASAATRQRLLRLLRGRVARAILNPVVAWVAFVAAQLAFHVTPLLDLAARHELHGVEHAILLATALAFWSVALAVEPLPRRLGGAARAGFLLGAMPASDAAAVYLITGGHAAAGAAMVAGMMPLGVAAVLVGWSWIVAEEREASLNEALGGTP